MTEETNQTLPKARAFSDEDVKRLASDDTLRAGTKENPNYYRVVVTKTNRGVVPEGRKTSGCLQVVLNMAPLADPEDGGSAVKKYTKPKFLVLPLANGDIDGHKAPDWSLNFCNEIFSALLPDRVPALPRFSNKQIIYKGKPIPKHEEKAAKIEATAATMSVANEIWNGDLDLTGMVAYVALIQNGEYTEFQRFRAELPAGITLTPESEFSSKG